MKHLLSILLLSTVPLGAAEILTLKNGDQRTGDIVSVDDRTVRLRVALTSGGAAQATATVSLNRADLASIRFAPDAALEDRLQRASPSDAPALERDWEKARLWLEMPESPAGRIALALGNAWLRSGKKADAQRALELVSQVEKSSWRSEDRTRAREARLRAMVASGRAADAVDEATKLAEETEDPEILIEANLIRAQASERQLRKFLQENPRWMEDELVIDERHRLHAQTLDLYLYPALFHGTDLGRAARGLWGAIEVHRLAGDWPNAVETARDLAMFYPSTPEAALANDFLASLPPAQRDLDAEAAARQELATATSSPQPTPTPEVSSEKPKKKKKPTNQKP